MTLRRELVTYSFLLVSFAGSIVSLRYLERIRPQATLEEVLYLPSPKILNELSLGYNTFIADIYWTRAVQYFGSKHQRNSTEYKLLYPLLDIATTLDPKLVPAYEFGSIFLTQKPPQGAGEPYKAIELLQRGIANNPGEWILYRDLGFVYYLELKDFPDAGKAFEQASEIPGAHPFLKVMAAKTLQQGGNYATSRLLWVSIATATKDKSIQENAVKHIRALDVDEQVPELEGLARRYHERTGDWPQSFAQMVAAGYVRGIPLDPIGNPYLLEPQGRVQVKDFINLPFISQGLPPGQEPSQFDLSGK